MAEAVFANVMTAEASAPAHGSHAQAWRDDDIMETNVDITVMSTVEQWDHEGDAGRGPSFDMRHEGSAGGNTLEARSGVGQGMDLGVGMGGGLGTGTTSGGGPGVRGRAAELQEVREVFLADLAAAESQVAWVEVRDCAERPATWSSSFRSCPFLRLRE